MKKLLTFALVIALVFALSLCANAEEITEPTDINDSVTVTEAEEKGIIDTIMNSTVWASITIFVTMASSVIVFVSKKLRGIATLIKSKADNKTILDGFNDAITDTMAEIKAKLAETEQRLAETQESEKTLLAILSMYIMNDSKYNTNAKAEIMKYITGIKGFSGTIAEICEEATEAIERANEAEVKEPTPALDAITSTISLD